MASILKKQPQPFKDHFFPVVALTVKALTSVASIDRLYQPLRGFMPTIEVPPDLGDICGQHTFLADMRAIRLGDLFDLNPHVLLQK